MANQKSGDSTIRPGHQQNKNDAEIEDQGRDLGNTTEAQDGVQANTAPSPQHQPDAGPVSPGQSGTPQAAPRKSDDGDK